jgi:hypothetical protein
VPRRARGCRRLLVDAGHAAGADLGEAHRSCHVDADPIFASEFLNVSIAGLSGKCCSPDELNTVRYVCVSRRQDQEYVGITCYWIGLKISRFW